MWIGKTGEKREAGKEPWVHLLKIREGMSCRNKASKWWNPKRVRTSLERRRVQEREKRCQFCAYQKGKVLWIEWKLQQWQCKCEAWWHLPELFRLYMNNEVEGIWVGQKDHSSTVHHAASTEGWHYLSNSNTSFHKACLPRQCRCSFTETIYHKQTMQSIFTFEARHITWSKSKF